MEKNNSIKNIIKNLQMAIELPKCRKCGCMKESLEAMKKELLKINNRDFLELLNEVYASIDKMEPVKYT
ncbi:hypothetical protein [Candidatus Clostridium radicumherbarum]|uniref:Uncharacterized protein n=1 Tax=Candidatus Clostridium radicumherbarum TaxID=3381662 RepID=A0ABW8TNP1_9CLOT